MNILSVHHHEPLNDGPTWAPKQCLQEFAIKWQHFMRKYAWNHDTA